MQTAVPHTAVLHVTNSYIKEGIMVVQSGKGNPSYRSCDKVSFLTVFISPIIFLDYSAIDSA